MTRNRGHMSVAAAAMLVVTGCSEGPPPDIMTTDGDQTSATGQAEGDTASATGSAEDQGSVPAELVWSADLTMLSRPTVADGVAVFYHQQEQGEDLTLSAHDLATGEHRWSAEVTPGGSFDVAAPSVVEVDGRHVVVTAAPAPERRGRLIALDLEDGHEVARAGDDSALGNFPTGCWPDDSTTCVTVFDDEAQEWVDSEAVVDGQTIVVTEEDDEQSEAEALLTREEEQPSYFDTRVDEDGGWFTFHRNGKVAWEVAATELGMEADPDDLPVGTFRPDDDVITSSVNWFGGVGEVADVADLSTVGLDTDTGEVLWQREGALLCGSRSEDVVVLCEGDGQINLDRGTGGVYQGADGEMIGVDVTTGDEVWSRLLSGQDWTVLPDMPTPFLDDSILLVGAEDPEVVDIVTGETLPTSAEDLLYSCWEAATWTHALPYHQDEPATGDRVSAWLGYGCDLDHQPVEIESWPADLEDYGVEAEGLRLIARPDRLEAYRLPG